MEGSRIPASHPACPTGGGVSLGTVQLLAGEDHEFARLEAIEKDGTKVMAAGPRLLIVDRRAGRR